MSARILLEALDVTAGYDGVTAIAGVTLAVRAGERVAVLGPNGGGKSTLLRVLTGELPPASGELRLSARVSIVPQSDRSRLDYPVSALDVALMGAIPRLPWWRRPGRSERAAALAALSAVGLADRARNLYGELSGGQRQRVLVARALVQDGELILLDEPFSGVDQASADVLERVIEQLAASGRGVLVATHDLDQARRLDRVLCLNGQQVAFGGPEVLTRPVLEATYGAEIVQVPGEPLGERGILPPHHHDHDHGDRSERDG